MQPSSPTGQLISPYFANSSQSSSFPMKLMFSFSLPLIKKASFEAFFI